MKANMNNRSETGIPSGYQPGGRWQISLKRLEVLFLATGMIVAFVASMAAGFGARGLVRGVWEGQVSIEGLGPIAVILGTIVGSIILHEALHAVVFLLIGAKPRFGFKIVGNAFAAAYTSTEKPVTRNQYLAVCLGPLFLLTLILMAVVIMANNDLLVMAALIALGINVSGSAGDVLIAAKIRKHERRTLFKDEEDGFSWFNPVG